MTTTLADRFMESMGEPIEVDGKQIHLWVEIGPLPASILRIELADNSDRPQGLCIEARGGRLTVAGQRSNSVVLWSDTAPPFVELEARPSGSREMTIRFWNAWRGDRDVVHSGIGNVGILVTSPRDDQLTLTCSDGWGPIEFGNLIAEIRWSPI